ncbi:MAG TPA: transcriptional repressor [Candidatus Dormibacteraeota bacterium]|nr:transcriptional repressor [Candidatus Dormibacteraeota bacterium]
MPRPSPVRDQVKELLLSGFRHAWSLEELLERVREGEVPGANYSSVFRAVTLFEEEGLVQRVEVGDGRARYEVRTPHHDHVHCERCGRVAEIEGGCLVGDAEDRVRNLTGYRLSGHTLVFSGLCPACQR